jgi:hypothetical protein
MARKTFALFTSCAVVLGASTAYAGPFGTLSSWRETPDFGPRGLTTNPDIAKWLMTLPRSDSWPEPILDQAMNPEIFGEKPIGGEAYQLSVSAISSGSAQVADASVARQLFNAEPMGSEPYRFTNPLAHPAAIAENIQPGSGAALEGRSASASRRADLETCTCMNLPTKALPAGIPAR